VVMRAAGETVHGARVGGLVVILWRAGLRINEALTLVETDLEPRRFILVRHGKGGKRREVGMDDWGWEQIEPWQRHRLELPVGPFLCVIDRSGSERARWTRAELSINRAGLRRTQTVGANVALMTPRTRPGSPGSRG
jgi:integrase